MTTLVTYATRHGATRGIAERIASTLARNGVKVVLKPVGEVGAIDAYDTFVIGSAAYMGGWLGEATTFVRRNIEPLSTRPVWLFSSGPVGPDKVDPKGRDVLMASRPKEFDEFAAALHPRDVCVFFGAYDPDAPAVGLAEKLGGLFLRLPEIRNALPAGDFRDWPAIDAWAEGIAQALQPATASASVPT